MVKETFIAIDIDYLEEIIIRNNHLQKNKESLLNAPINQPFTRENLNQLVKKMDDLNFAIKQMKDKKEEIAETEVDDLIHQT